MKNFLYIYKAQIEALILIFVAWPLAVFILFQLGKLFFHGY